MTKKPSSTKGLERLSPGVYRDPRTKKIVRISSGSRSINNSSSRKNDTKKKDKKPKVRGREISLNEDIAPRRIIYGGILTEGQITFAHVNQQWLHLVVTFSGHKVHSIPYLYLDDRYVTFNPDRWGSGEWNDQVFFANDRVGWDDQIVQADLKTQSQGFRNNIRWTDDHRQRGCSHAYLILKFSDRLFPEGLPKISCVVNGKEVLDPRTNTVIHTSNAALIIADYLKSYVGIPWDNIDQSALIEGANICDEVIIRADGIAEPRYTINASFDEPEQDHRPILEQMCQAMGGDICFQNGKWRILPGKYRAPSLDLTIDDCFGPLKVDSIPRREVFNAVKGTFTDPLNKWEQSDFPIVKNSFYESEDGSRVYTQLDLNFVTSSATAQRLAKMHLERSRQGIVVSGRFHPRAYALQVGDTCTLTLLQYGWESKVFEVKEVQLSIDTETGIGVQLALRETAAACFDWNNGEETTYDVAPDTLLPNSYDPVEPPTALTLASGTAHLYKRGDGSIVSRIFVSWTESESPFVPSGGRYEVQYKRSDSSTWLPAGTTPGGTTSLYIDAQDGVNHDVRVRAVTIFGVPSDWVESLNHFVVGKTEPPSNVATFNATLQSFGILLGWTKINDIDASYYEIRQGGGSWETSSLVGTSTTQSFNLPITTAGSYTFRIKAVDTSGNFSVSDTITALTIPSPQAPTVSSSFDGSMVRLNWSEVQGAFAIGEYEIYYGPNSSSLTSLGTSKTTTFTLLANWSGERIFWIRARDVAGNAGIFGSVPVNVVAPGQVQSLRTQVIDNTALLSYSPPVTGSLPIQDYEIRQGSDWSTASIVGNIRGTFFSKSELIAGMYTYLIAARDSAGNLGSIASISANVAQPPDFVLRESLTIPNSSATLSSAFLDSGDVLLPVNTSETWDQHFSTRSWTTVQNQIDAGFPFYCQPSTASGTYRYTYDYGALVGGTTISLSYIWETISGTVTLSPTIEVSTDNTTWTTYSGSLEIFAANFRYVRITITGTGANTQSFGILKSVNLSLRLKRKTDEGQGVASSSDASGTVVNFNVPFVDVESLNVTPQSSGGSAISAVVDFVDVPNPTSFKVYLFNSSGTRVSGNFYWTVRGA